MRFDAVGFAEPDVQRVALGVGGVGFKSDREFLRIVSIGAVGTRKVAELLRAGGFRIIELERYCSCNKIWATKIKRLRVPDLLCLKTGIRIECRAKSVLKVTMSHAVSNADRAWDKGLRDDDFVVFIRCTPQDDGWQAADRLSLFLPATCGVNRTWRDWDA